MRRPDGWRVELPALRLLPGETAMLHGPSGCGKTSLLLGMFGLLGADGTAAGRVQVQGEAVLAAPARRRAGLLRQAVAFVMQDAASALDPLQPVGRQMVEATGRTVAECVAALGEMGVDDAAGLLERLPGAISGGQAQRVLLAVAWLRRPVLLVADEPSASLDGDSFAEVRRRLERLREQTGTALLLASHDRRLLADAARVLVCEDGAFAEGRPKAMPWPRRQGRGVAGDELLRLDDVHVRLGARAVLAGVSLRIARGEVVALVGESGAGKTTLARVLLGHRRPAVGQVQRPRRGAVQMLYQDAAGSLTPGRSIRSLLEETAVPGVDVGALAHRLGLGEGALGRSVEGLSGGERRRAALLRAMAVRPELLVLDEPTASLDRTAALAVMDLILDLQREHGLALLLITHDEELAAAVADRTLRLQGGRLWPV